MPVTISHSRSSMWNLFQTSGSIHPARDFSWPITSCQAMSANTYIVLKSAKKAHPSQPATSQGSTMKKINPQIFLYREWNFMLHSLTSAYFRLDIFYTLKMLIHQTFNIIWLVFILFLARRNVVVFPTIDVIRRSIYSWGIDVLERIMVFPTIDLI